MDKEIGGLGFLNIFVLNWIILEENASFIERDYFIDCFEVLNFKLLSGLLVGTKELSDCQKLLEFSKYLICHLLDMDSN